MWKDAIHERILNNQNDVCRKLSKHEKEYCQKPPFKPHKLARRVRCAGEVLDREDNVRVLEEPIFKLAV